jgi:hypothetical protein
MGSLLGKGSRCTLSWKIKFSFLTANYIYTYNMQQLCTHSFMIWLPSNPTKGFRTLRSISTNSYTQQISTTLCLFLQGGCMSFYNLTRKLILYCIFCIFVIHSTSYCHFDWILYPKTVWHICVCVCACARARECVCHFESYPPQITIFDIHYVFQPLGTQIFIK